MQTIGDRIWYRVLAYVLEKIRENDADKGFSGGFLDASHVSGVGSSSLLHTAVNHVAATLGQLLYAGTAGAWTLLAGNTTTTRKFLRQTGTGAVSAAPAWDTLVDGDIPTTLANKTLTTPTIADFTNAQHDHGDADDGGAISGFVSVLTAYKDADQEVTDTTLAADSELTITLATNGKYQFKFDLFMLNDGAAEGIKVSLNGTATVTDVKAQAFIWDDTLNTLVGFARITALGGAGVGAGVSSGSNRVTIEGSIEITTAGTLLLEFAQNATGASAGVHCEVGSSLVAVKLE